MADTLCISTARPGDGARVRAFYDDLTDAMADAPYPPGWRKGVYPTRAFARRGIAQRMVQYAIGTARAQDCHALRLDVLGGNVPAERLYAGQDFARRGMVRMFYDDTGWTDYGFYEYLL